MNNEDRLMQYQLVETTDSINSETGEVDSELVVTKTNYKVLREPNFIKLYLDHLSRFKGIQVGLNPILMEMMRSASYANIDDRSGGQVICLNKWLKESIAKKCNVSIYRIEQAISEFVKKDYMKRIAIGTYQLNPFLFGKGEWTDIVGIRATYDYATGKVTTEIIHEGENDESEANPN